MILTKCDVVIILGLCVLWFALVFVLALLYWMAFP